MCIVYCYRGAPGRHAAREQQQWRCHAASAHTTRSIVSHTSVNGRHLLNNVLHGYLKAVIRLLVREWDCKLYIWRRTRRCINSYVHNLKVLLFYDTSTQS